VPVDKQYATAKEAITFPYKGRLTQQGWVLPSEADASALMKQVTRRLPQCRYNGSASDPVDPTRRISGISTPGPMSLTRSVGTATGSSNS
jgi:hypothetical protein